MDRSYGGRSTPELISCKTECGSQSIVRTLDHFLQAFERMRAVIMVPSCLRDMDVTVRFEQGAERNGHRHQQQHNNTKSSDSGFTSGPASTSSHTNHTVASGRSTPNECNGDTAGGNGGGGGCGGGCGGQLVISNGHAGSAKMDLHKIYKVLHAVHNELTAGSHTPPAPASLDASADSFSAAAAAVFLDEEDEDAESAQLAALFRTHLHGLFGVMKQMTDAADYVSGRYQSRMPGGAQWE